MGATQGILTIAWWLFDLVCRYTGVIQYPHWAIPSLWAHAFLMIYGFFPFFISGFLMTAAPNWVNGQRVARTRYVQAFLFMMSGAVSYYPALVLGRTALAIAVGLSLLGWISVSAALLNIVLNSPSADKRHAYTVVANLFVGATGMTAYLAWLMSGNMAWLHCSITSGIWLFLLPIFVSVSHRMIPFFSSTVLLNYEPKRPYWALFGLLIGAVQHAILDLSGKASLLWIPDLPMSVMALYLAVLWGFRRSFSVRLLAMLHIGFAWLWIALALFAIQSFTMFMSGRIVLGMAPLHALTIGYFSSMVLAMVTRVTLGHSGRLATADKTVWYLFLGFQITALLRITGDIVRTDGAYFYILAALIWIFSFVLWSIKHLPIYWESRSKMVGKRL